MKKKYLKPDLEVIALETCVTLGGFSKDLNSATL